MKTTYSTKTGKLTITLDNLEIRQIRGSSQETVGKIIKEAADAAIRITHGNPLPQPKP